MTTFTMQDLNNMPTTTEEDEAMEALAKLGGGVDLKSVFTQMGSDLTGGKSNTFDVPNPDAIQYTHGGTLGAPEPQPTLADIINNICTQLQLLSTVISSVEEKSSSNESLQECVSLTLQQADWFKEMVRGIVDDTYDFADYAENAVEHVVEKEVEHYFDSSFNPEDHFDFGDAVSDAVDDRIDDIVSDKIDDAVDSYLSNATISISK